MQKVAYSFIILDEIPQNAKILNPICMILHVSVFQCTVNILPQRQPHDNEKPFAGEVEQFSSYRQLLKTLKFAPLTLF